MLRRVLLALLIAAACAAPALAQAPLPEPDSARIVRIRLKDGTEFQGRIAARTDTSVVLVSSGGLRMDIPQRLVASWETLRGEVVAGRYRERDPNTTRLFFAPTGRTLDQGDGYFADYYIFFPFVAYGITDRLTLAAGASIFPGAESQLVYIAPKLGLYRAPKLNVSVGGIYVTIPGEEESISAAYAGATWGNNDNAFTFLGGMAFGGGESTPGFIAGFERRISGSVKIIGEGWFFPEMEEDLVVPIVIGPRFFGRKIAVDLGLAYFVGADAEGWPFLPWVDFVVNF